MRRQARTIFTALILVAAAAGGHASDAAAQPVTGGGAGGVVGVQTRPGPRFVVNALFFKALNETGWDWTGADEVVFVYQTPAYKLVTFEYPSINSDDTEHEFPPRDTCVAPAYDDNGFDHRWKCVETGMAAPLSFAIGVYEQDEFQHGIFGFCATNLNPDSDLRKPSEEQCAEAGELIGKENVEYSLATLLAKLPAPGQFFTERLDLYGGCDGSVQSEPCTTPDGVAHYVVVYKVTRLPDATGPAVDPTP